MFSTAFISMGQNEAESGGGGEGLGGASCLGVTIKIYIEDILRKIIWCKDEDVYNVLMLGTEGVV